ncbi:MAG: hypothetical protein CMJ18_24180 [Phycisphaeraceae bacterium]|nr:hypothetical protein [Phycisphaeraceae bacterium]
MAATQPTRTMARQDGRQAAAIAIEGLSAVLEQLARVLDGMTDDAFAIVPGGPFRTSHVGNHVRHCLDHVEQLLTGLVDGVIRYDRRCRGTAIETDRTQAIEAIDRMARRLAQLGDVNPERTVRVEDSATAEGPRLATTSTAGRELMFVISHTVHHNATIGAMIRQMGGEVPEAFGLAPSTAAWIRSQA